MFAGRYLGRYRELSGNYPNSNELGNSWIIDASARYEAGRGARGRAPWLAGSYVALGAVNLFNKTPPFSFTPFWYDIKEYDVRGRFLHLNVVCGSDVCLSAGVQPVSCSVDVPLCCRQRAVRRQQAIYRRRGNRHCSLWRSLWEEAQSVEFSPDGKYFAALTERGRIDLDRPEDTLRIYRARDVVSFLRRADGAQRPAPL